MKRVPIFWIMMVLVLSVSGMAVAASGDVNKPISLTSELLVSVGKWAEVSVGQDETIGGSMPASTGFVIEDDMLAVSLTRPGDVGLAFTKVKVKSNTDVSVSVTPPEYLADEDGNRAGNALKWFISFDKKDRTATSYIVRAKHPNTRYLYFYAKWDSGDNWWELQATEPNKPYKGTAVIVVQAKN